MATNQIKLVVSDLDGTLLNHQHKLTQKTQQTVQQLVEQGVMFMLATGRHYQDVHLIAEQLGVDMCLITSNGARVHNQSGELLYENHMPADLVAQALALSNQFDVHRNLYQQENWWVDAPHEELLAIHDTSGFRYQITDFSELNLEQIDKIYFTASHQQLLLLEAELKQSLGDLLSITFTSPEYLVIMNLGVSKGQALAMLMQKRQVEAKQVMALGDGMNDRDMLQLVGHSVVMANASDAVKACLPNANRAKSNAENGVAEYLLQTVLAK